MKPELGLQQELIRNLIAAVAANAIQSDTFSYGPTAVAIDSVRTFSRTLTLSSGQGVPVADIDEGVYSIIRHRGGTNTTIVNQTACDTPSINGLVTFTYTFAAATWDEGDFYTVIFEEQEDTNLGTEYTPGYVFGEVQAITTLESDVADILADTEVIGTPVDTDLVTDIANVQAAVDSITTSSDLNAAVPEPPTAKAMTDILHKDGSYTYDNTTDSLEAIRDALDGQNDIDSAAVNAACATALSDYDAPTKTELDTLIGTPVDTDVVTDVANVQAAVDALNDVSEAEVNAQVDSALNTAVPTSPTARSVNAMLEKNTSGTYDRATDSLEAIRDYLGAPVEDVPHGEAGTQTLTQMLVDTLRAVGGQDLAAEQRAMEAIGEWAVSGTGPTLTANNGTFHRSGSGSLKVDVTGANMGAQLDIGAGHNMNRPGALIYAAIWVYSTAANTIDLSVQRSGGSLIDGTRLDGSSSQDIALIANQWNKLEAFFTAPNDVQSESNNFRFIVRTGTDHGSWTFYLDDPTVRLLDWSPIDARFRQIWNKAQYLPDQWTNHSDSDTVTTTPNDVLVIASSVLMEVGQISILTPASVPGNLTLTILDGSIVVWTTTYTTPNASQGYTIVSGYDGAEDRSPCPKFFSGNITVRCAWSTGSGTIIASAVTRTVESS